MLLFQPDDIIGFVSSDTTLLIRIEPSPFDCNFGRMIHDAPERECSNAIPLRNVSPTVNPTSPLNVARHAANLLFFFVGVSPMIRRGPTQLPVWTVPGPSVKNYPFCSAAVLRETFPLNLGVPPPSFNALPLFQLRREFTMADTHALFFPMLLFPPLFW